MSRVIGRWFWWALMGTPLLVFLMLPVASIALRSAKVANSVTPEFYLAVRLSFETSLVSLLTVIVFGTPLAFAIARYPFPFRRVISVLVDLPIALPPAAAGIGLLLAFGRQGLIPTSLGFTTIAVVMAQCFVASPFYVRAAITAFQAVDRDVEDSAALDGAKPIVVFQRITIPICINGLASGAITTWARALGEFGATILFAGNLVGKTQTMPLAIYLGFESDFDQAILLSGVLLAVAFLTIIAVRILAESQVSNH